MHRQREVKRHGWLLLISVGAIVLAFMGLSLAITATGTARFAVAMGYRAEVGYVVGGVFDLLKPCCQLPCSSSSPTRLHFLRRYRICLPRPRGL